MVGGGVQWNSRTFGRGGAGRTSDTDLDGSASVRWLSAHHLAQQEGGCQRGDGTQGQSGLCGVVRAWTCLSSVEEGRLSACPPLAAAQAETLRSQETWLVQIFQEGCLLLAPRLRHALYM